MQKVCAKCQADFIVYSEDLALLEKLSPEFGGKKVMLPPPTHCPDCRLQRRTAHRNQIYVYQRPDSITGEAIFSMWNNNAPFPVIHNDRWWNIEYDMHAGAQDYDFNRSFFEQFTEVRNASTHPARSISKDENSDYSNNATAIRNCYLVFNATETEDCLCCEDPWFSKDCLDCNGIPNCELCYDCTSCFQCYGLQSSQFCIGSRHSYFLLNCNSCEYCFGCVNLRHAKYCMFNEQLTKEEYEQRMAELDLSSYSQRQAIAKRCEDFFIQHPRPHVFGMSYENSTGNFLRECNDVHHCFITSGAENVRYCHTIREDCKDMMDHNNVGIRCELTYECSVCGVDANNLQFTHNCWGNVTNLLYSSFCVGVSDLFGCVALQKKQYCILNKQYTEEQYNSLVPKIIEHMRSMGEWGEFFPMELSATPYNQSFAQRLYPLTKTEVNADGLEWLEETQADHNQKIAELPDGLPQTDESIVTTSTKSGKIFNISAREISMLRMLNAPLPRTTYDERINSRAAYYGPPALFERTCPKSGKTIHTNISPETPWIVWDKDVYEQEFSG